MKNTHQKGFTLVEILVVLAVIMLLFALIFPVMMNARMLAYRSACLSNLRETALIFHSYATDSRGHLPLANATNPRIIRPDTHKAIEDYYEGPYDIFYCPSARSGTDSKWWDICMTWDANHYRIGYVYVANLDEKNCSKFIYGDPVANIMDPTAAEGPVLFDVCAKNRGSDTWNEFPHDGVDSPEGMNALFGDMHAEWRPLSELKVRYNYIAPVDLWW